MREGLKSIEIEFTPGGSVYDSEVYRYLQKCGRWNRRPAV
jgi:hypothetical protein